MTLVLDAGALVALERNDRDMWGRLNAAFSSHVAPVTHGGIVGQVWRGGYGKQAQLAKALQGIEIYPLDFELGRRAGVLLARSHMKDVIDAGLVALARDGDTIATSDPDDIATLAITQAIRVDIVTV